MCPGHAPTIAASGGSSNSLLPAASSRASRSTNLRRHKQICECRQGITVQQAGRTPRGHGIIKSEPSTQSQPLKLAVLRGLLSSGGGGSLVAAVRQLGDGDAAARADEVSHGTHLLWGDEDELLTSQQGGVGWGGVTVGGGGGGGGPGCSGPRPRNIGVW